MLGNLAVVRDGAEMELPPSKKTRALLAYLALTPGSVPRERLCHLLWQVPSDPRGELRWSLSKIRLLMVSPSEVLPAKSMMTISSALASSSACLIREEREAEAAGARFARRGLSSENS